MHIVAKSDFILHRCANDLYFLDRCDGRYFNGSADSCSKDDDEFKALNKRQQRQTGPQTELPAQVADKVLDLQQIIYNPKNEQKNRQIEPIVLPQKNAMSNLNTSSFGADKRNTLSARDPGRHQPKASILIW